jgi:hypothetical protein
VKEYSVFKIKAAIAALLLALSSTALAVDGMSFEYGKSNSTNADVKLYRLGVQWDWGVHWLNAGSYSLGGYWDVSAGYWENNSANKSTSSLGDFGFTPVFRWQETRPHGVSPYAELAVGVHFLTTTSVSDQRKFGSSFQFGDHVGVGLRFGDRGEYDIGYRYQHLSNAGIKEPNQGINFNQLRLQYHF